MSVIKMRPWGKTGDVFRVWQPECGETEEDAREVEACDSETAAEDYAEWSDSNGDYTIVRGSEATLHVRRTDDEAAEVEVFVVTGESVPHYSATPKREGKR